jgi:hypothetical protein
MKICSKCGFPLTCTAKIIQSAWKILLDHEYNDSKIEKTESNAIQFKQDDLAFTLKLSQKPVRATEKWDTPFGIHENTVNINREVIELISKWYKVLTKDNNIDIISSMKHENLIKTKITTSGLCTFCRGEPEPKEDKKSSVREKPKKKVVAKKDKKATVGVGVTIEERIAEAKKRKISWEEIIVMYLEENTQSTKDRHVDEIARALETDATQILDIIKELVQENKIQKEFPLFEDYYILTQDYKAEITRKYLEIQNYFKIRADDPYCCTQASVSLEFELPFSIVGVILNDMTNSKLIRKETAEITKEGISRKVRYYTPYLY